MRWFGREFLKTSCWRMSNLANHFIGWRFLKLQKIALYSNTFILFSRNGVNDLGLIFDPCQTLLQWSPKPFPWPVLFERMRQTPKIQNTYVGYCRSRQLQACHPHYRNSWKHYVSRPLRVWMVKNDKLLDKWKIKSKFGGCGVKDSEDLDPGCWAFCQLRLIQLKLRLCDQKKDTDLLHARFFLGKNSRC